MQNVVSTTASSLDHLGVVDGAAEEIDSISRTVEVGLFACGKIVEHCHAVAAADEFVHGIRADESGAARDQIAHRCLPPRRNPPIAQSATGVRNFLATPVRFRYPANISCGRNLVMEWRNNACRSIQPPPAGRLPTL